MQLEKGKKYRIEELKLFPEWELRRNHNENNIEIVPIGVSYTKGGIHVTQQVLDSWTIEEIQPKLKTGYYTTKRLKNELVYRVEVTEGDGDDIVMWVALDLAVPEDDTDNNISGVDLNATQINTLVEEGLIPCKISIET